MVYAFDTNTISYFLRGEGNIEKMFAQEIIKNKNQYAIPLIVVYEIKRWLFDKPNKILKIFIQEFDALFQSVKIKSKMDFDVWEKSAEIYIDLKQKGKLIGDNDIIIAAYCIVNNYTLVTRNIGDFSRISDLKFVNWFEN